jgi:hypothetical protein
VLKVRDKCIYCAAPVDLRRGQGDHVIPAALGRFENEFIFRRICRDCNGTLGRCEEQILKCAPEAVVRRIVRPTVKRKKRGESWVGAHGMPPPKFTVDHGTHHELVDGSTEDPRTVYPVDQIVIMDKEKGEHHVRLHPDMSAAQLRAKLAALNVTPSEGSHLYADDDNWPKYDALIREVCPGYAPTKAGFREKGITPSEGTTIFTFHADYWRAVAKIGFHYYLLNNRRGLHGDEPEFFDLRRFIIEGGDHTLFFKTDAAQIRTGFGKLPNGKTVLPNVWMHTLAAAETPSTAVAMVSLFMGPERLAPSYHINLGKLHSRLVVPNSQWAHSYDYHASSQSGRYAGRVTAGSLTRFG